MSGRGVRHLAKRLVERCVVVGGGASLVRNLQRHRSVILLYHNIVPDGARPAGDASLHLPRQDFACQLDELRSTHRVVPLSDLFDAAGRYRREEADGADLDRGADGAGRGFGSSNPTRARAAITFDDAYRGAVTVGARELARRGMPATFFASPGLLGQPGFWWDEVAPFGTDGLPDELREEALVEGRGVRDEVLRWAETRGLARRSPPDHAGVATEEELVALAETPGVSFGSHTWSHANLARLGRAEAERELARSMGWLRQRFPGRLVPWLSLPYGRSGDDVREMAERVGHLGMLRIRGGLAGPDTDRFDVPRVNVPAGLSLDGFVLRAAGL